MLKIQHELRFALRTWRRSSGVAVLAIVTLGLGIGATTALFSVVHAVLLRSFGYQNPDQLVQIGGTNRQGQQTGVSAPDFRAIQQSARSFQQVGASRVQAFTIRGGAEPVNVYGQLVSSDCFAILGARPAIGRVFTESDFASSAPPVALLSHRLWQQNFAGDPRIVGQQVLIDGVNYSIIGVMPAEFQFPHPAFRIWTPWQLSAQELANHRGHSYRLVARLRPGVTQAMASSELAAISTALERESPDTNGGWRATIEPIAESLIGRLRPALWTMLGAVAFVLLIACLNVSNLLMARGLARTRELAVRAALGAPRIRLAAQLLIEGLVIAGAGGLLGVATAHSLLRLLVMLVPTRAAGAFPRIEQASLNGGVLGAALLMTLVSGVLFSLLPALELSRPDIEAALREGGRTQTGGRRHRRYLSALLVAESALSVILLVGAGLMLRSFAQITAVDPGFHAEHVLAAEIPSPWPSNFVNPAERAAAKARNFDQLVQALEHIPGANAAGLITGLPMGTVASQTLIRLEGRNTPANLDLRVGYSSISPGYFHAMGIPMTKGRSFAETDTTGQPAVAIINQAMARHLWPDEDPIGKRITLNPNGTGPWVTIVGIVRDVRNMGLTTEPESQLYMPYRQSLLAPQNAAVVLRTALDPASQASAIRAAIHQIDSGQPVSEVRTMLQVVADSMTQTRLYTVLLSIFGLLALSLAAAGIFSVLSWTVSQKLHEIGIRMALGASPRHVVSAVMRRAMLETLTGCVVGLAGAAALAGIIRTQLYHVPETDLITFIVAPVVLLGAAASAAYLPAQRAVRVSPVTALTNL